MTEQVKTIGYGYKKSSDKVNDGYVGIGQVSDEFLSSLTSVIFLSNNDTGKVSINIKKGEIDERGLLLDKSHEDVVKNTKNVLQMRFKELEIRRPLIEITYIDSDGVGVKIKQAADKIDEIKSAVLNSVGTKNLKVNSGVKASFDW